MSGQPVISSDNGFIILRASDGSYSVVYNGVDHAFQHDIIGLSGAEYNDPTKIATTQNLAIGGLDLTKPLYSTATGATWIVGSNTPPDLSTYGALQNSAKTGIYNWAIEEDGHVWAQATRTSDSHVFLFRSDDITVSNWNLMFDGTAVFGANFSSSFSGATSIWVGNGLVWWLDGLNNTLWSCNTDGTGAASYSITPPSGNLGDYIINGWPNTNRLIAWTFNSDFFIMTVDITIPTSPSFTFSSNQPFGAGQGTWDVYPLTNKILVANVVNGNEPTTQSVQYASMDRGEPPLETPIASGEVVIVNWLTGPTISGPWPSPPMAPTTTFTLNGLPYDVFTTVGGSSGPSTTGTVLVELLIAGVMQDSHTFTVPFSGGTTLEALGTSSAGDTVQVKITNNADNDVYFSDAVFEETPTIEADETLVGVLGSGSIYRSADGGSTWSNVVPETTQLGTGRESGTEGENNNISAVAPDPASTSWVWCCLRPPFVYYSSDQGASWTFESVDLSIFTPYLSGSDVAPENWTGISVVGALIAAGKMPIIVCLVGAT